MLIFSLLFSLAIQTAPVENYFLRSSTMHGGTPDSGTSYGKAYHFAIHEKVAFPNLNLEEELLVLKKGDTLIYSVISHSSSNSNEDRSEKSSFDVRLYESKYYVSCSANDQWEKGLLYRRSRQVKLNEPELKTVPDETSTGFAP